MRGTHGTEPLHLEAVLATVAGADDGARQQGLHVSSEDSHSRHPGGASLGRGVHDLQERLAVGRHPG